MADMYEKVKNKRKEEFLIGYNIIRQKLKEMYQMITLGGNADFELVDSFDPFSEGIQFKWVFIVSFVFLFLCTPFIPFAE